MRARKTNKSRSVKYLLSADRRLQKLSLRKIREGVKKTSRPARSVPPAQSAIASLPVPPPPKAYSWRVIAVGFACVMAAVALMTARQPEREVDTTASIDPATASMVRAPKSQTPAAAPIEAKKSVASKPVTIARKPSATPAAIPAATPAATPAVTPTAKVAPAATADSDAAEPASPPVTITGCLQQDGGSFWLKDTSGAEAPKSRSWRTGFLKKRSSRIELVDAPAALRLAAHVGARVAATGSLLNREMHPRSVRRVAASCE